MLSFVLLPLYFCSVLSVSNLIQNDAKSINEAIKSGKVPFPPPPYQLPQPFYPFEGGPMTTQTPPNKPDILVFPDHSQKDTQIHDVKPTTTTLRPAKRACETYLKLSDDRILGGSAANSREFPWMAALGFLNDQYQVTFDCGGTIISEFFVLTAAHCVATSRPPVVVRLGKIKLLDDDGVRPDNHPIQDIIKHANYSSRTKKDDIALIRVAKRIYFTSDIVPACLQTDLIDIHPSVPLLVTGWGKTAAERGERSNILLKTQLKTMSLPECNQVYSEWNKLANQAALRNGIGQGQYCAYDPQARNDSCQGDSGGPLQYFPTENTAISTVLGIVSFGFSCGTELPGIYTRVAYYLDWIEPNVWSNP